MRQRLEAQWRQLRGHLHLFVKWTMISVSIGLLVGSVSSLFALCLQKVTALRAAHGWIIFLLPLAGLLIVFCYRYFLGEDRSQYWFVHFTGRAVKSILRHYEIPLDGYVLHTGISYQYEDLFKKMRDELLDCEFCYEENLTYLLRELFIVMNRKMHQSMPTTTGFVRTEMDYARDYFREHYNEDISIEQYAAGRNMSTSWFGACFREYFGTSPMKFILNLRIYNAQILLETTDDTVGEISRRVGYENPMYFSRAFRKAKGLSPMKYRKVFREKLLEESTEGSRSDSE